LVAIASEESFYILRFDRDAYTAKLEEGADLGDEGVEEAFEMMTEVHEKYLECLISRPTLSYSFQDKNGSMDWRLPYLYQCG